MKPPAIPQGTISIFSLADAVQCYHYSSFITDNMKSQSSVPCKSIDKEAADYLCDPNIATNSLLKYPHLLQAFLKFNATLLVCCTAKQCSCGAII
jgi:hypothetical protein